MQVCWGCSPPSFLVFSDCFSLLLSLCLSCLSIFSISMLISAGGVLSQFKYGHYALNINYNCNILLLFLPRRIAIVWELAPRFDWQNMNVKLYCIRICVYVCTTPAAYSATIFTILVAPCLLFCYLAKVATTELNGAHILFKLIASFLKHFVHH